MDDQDGKQPLFYILVCRVLKRCVM